MTTRSLVRVETRSSPLAPICLNSLASMDAVSMVPQLLRSQDYELNSHRRYLPLDRGWSRFKSPRNVLGHPERSLAIGPGRVAQLSDLHSHDIAASHLRSIARLSSHPPIFLTHTHTLLLSLPLSPSSSALFTLASRCIPPIASQMA